jgi:hypothetical protein
VVEALENCCSALHVFALAVLSEIVRSAERSPPPERDALVLICREVETLLLKVDQSEVERSPRLLADAVGKLKVSVEPEPVMAKSVPLVEEAKVTAGPVVVCPAGPIEVRADTR